MYKKTKFVQTGFNINESTEGESIEMKMRRVIANKEPITDGAPKIYTERSEGVKAGYNVRTDRFEIALEATTVITGAKEAQRASKGKIIELNPEKDGKTETIQGTAENL